MACVNLSAAKIKQSLKQHLFHNQVWKISDILHSIPIIKICDANTEGLVCLMQICSITTLCCEKDTTRLEADI